MNFGTHLFNNFVRVASAEALLQVLMFGYFSFRNIHENVHYLKYVIEIRFDAIAPFLDFVLVACDL